MLFGGATPNAVRLGDTWEFFGETWRELTPATGPEATQSHGIVYDTKRNRGVLFGGLSSTGLTWEWIGPAAVPINQ